jgi:hypothetical protein
MRTKTGLDYFPLDVDWLSDDKLTIVQADFGNRGIGIVIRLLGDIYRNGYSTPWGERDQKRFALRAGEPVADVVALVDSLISEGFFDQTLARSQNPILTSAGIQKRWKLAVSRRAQSCIPDAINLLTVEAGERVKMSTTKASEGVRLHTVEASESVEMSAICKQYDDNMSAIRQQSRHKVKESKVKESKNNPPKSPLAGGLIFPPELDTSEHREAWEKFIEHRRRIRKPYRSIESQNEQLKKWGDRAHLFITAITNTIANEWQGLHEPSPTKQNSIAGISAKEQRALEVIKMFSDEEASGV